MSNKFKANQAGASVLLELFDEDEKELLKRGSVFRFITRESAKAATDSQKDAERLLENPILRKVSWGSQEDSQEIWEIPIDIRRVLLGESDSESEQIRNRVAKSVSSEDRSYDSLYARLSAPEYAAVARDQLKSDFDAALAKPVHDIARAHDLSNLLIEWPINQDAASRRLFEELCPKLNRYARAARDFEATTKYVERDFESTAMKMLLGDSSQWMLQIYAPGGRGKTMFLRNLLGRYCTVNDIPVARIDFDFLEHLTIVTQRPWRILLTIARQLNDQLPNEPFRFMLESWGEYEAKLVSNRSTVKKSLAASEEFLSGETLADEISKKFAYELADAAKDHRVLIVLDTFENVLHSIGASLEPLLTLLNEIRFDGSSQQAIVPGLRVILCGRFDLETRSNRFRENWVGPTNEVTSKDFGDGSKIRVGKSVLSVELKDFSEQESREYLFKKCNLEDKQKINAIMVRCHALDEAGIRRSNPMTLALIAEHIQENPDIKAADITAFKSIELFYLIDRVVDRIGDGRVQWLLRWGVLPNILTKEFVTAIIWPALLKFVIETNDYDDATDDSLDAPRHQNERWAPLSLVEVESPNSATEAWNRLLDYAAKASWVSIHNEMPDAVVFHPEVRDPLRNLLREKDAFVYHDIQSKSFEYWKGRINKSGDSELSAVLSGVMHHVYQPWREDGNKKGEIRRNSGQLLRQLLGQFVDNRIARHELAEEVLKAYELSKASSALKPSSDEQLCAHLELAEFHVYDVVTNGVPLNEGIVSRHLEEARAAVAQRSNEELAKNLASGDSKEVQRILDDELRRMDFLSAVQMFGMNKIDEAWDAFSDSLAKPKPDKPDQITHFQLVVDVAVRLDVRSKPLGVARKLAKCAQGTPVEAKALRFLAGCLVSHEKWTEALRIARKAKDRSLEANAMLQLGQAKHVESNREFPPLYRAEAAIQLLSTNSAFKHLKEQERQDSQKLLAEARAFLLAHNFPSAKSLLSSAMTEGGDGFQFSYAAEAWLCLCRVLIDEGNYGNAFSELLRPIFRDYSNGTGHVDSVSYRAEALSLVVDNYQKVTASTAGPKPAKELEEELADQLFDDLRQRVLEDKRQPPSVLVQIELARLEMQGATDELLGDLGDALERLDHYKTRLLALRDLSRVKRVSGQNAPKRKTAARLEEITNGRADQPALKLGRAELFRVLGNDKWGKELIDELVGVAFPEAEQFAATLQARFQSKLKTPEDVPDDDSQGEKYFDNSKTFRFEISRTKIGDLEVIARLGPSDAEEFGNPIGRFKEFQESHYQLAKNPTKFMDELGQALMWNSLEDLLHRAGSVELELDAGDEWSAKIPWELATSGSHRLSSFVSAIIRRPSVRASRKVSGSPIYSPAIYLAANGEDILMSSKTRSLDEIDLDMIAELYERHTNASILIKTHVGENREMFDRAGNNVRVVHFISPIANRRNRAMIRLGSESLTAETIVHLFSDGSPRLIIFDLLFSHSDTDAAEQLMLANALFWSITESDPSLSIISGVFGTDRRRKDFLERLISGLSNNEELIEIVGALQSMKSDPSTHPLRTAVSLWSSTPNIIFQLGKPKK